MQEYINIPFVNGGYKINKYGIIKNKFNRILKTRKDKSGYIIIGLNKTTFCIHRIVAMTFIPNPDGKLTVNHKNGVKSDNKVENLERMTMSENQKHSYVSLGRKGAGGNYRLFIK